MLQNLIVALIVVLALLHFCRRYLPAALRRRWADALGQRGVDARLLARLFGVREGCGDGCSACRSPGRASALAGWPRVVRAGDELAGLLGQRPRGAASAPPVCGGRLRAGGPVHLHRCAERAGGAHGRRCKAEPRCSRLCAFVCLVPEDHGRHLPSHRVPTLPRTPQPSTARTHQPSLPLVLGATMTLVRSTGMYA